MKKQNIIVVLLFLFIFVMSVGYVIYDIDAEVEQKTANSKNLEVIFERVGEIEEVDCVNSSAEISNNKKQLVINIPNMYKMGAYAIFPVTIKNVGSIPARLESISEYGLNHEAITITYDGIGITDNVLYPGIEKMFTVKVMWENELWHGKKNYNFLIKFNYEQAN